MTSAEEGPLSRTPLFDWHVSHGAKMVPFAGFEMPVQYPLGVLKEHLWTRDNAGLFDVSHMGQAVLIAEDGRHETVAAAMERLVPADVLNIKPGQQRYSQLLATDGGILDDLMMTRPTDPKQAGQLILVVNAACKDADYKHISAHLPKGVRLEQHPDKALFALQGPKAAAVLSTLLPSAATHPFMTAVEATVAGVPCFISRSGYTGEDGYEISVPGDRIVEIWGKLAAHPDAEAIGLGARDSLRLEAGLCLYGHDIDTTTSPIEAGLIWSIQKRRRTEGGFPGAARIQNEIAAGPSRVRVGLKPEGRAPAREGAEICDKSGKVIGKVTSGGFGPSANGPIAMGYVASAHGKAGTPVDLMVRGKPLAAAVIDMPFVPHRYFRKV